MEYFVVMIDYGHAGREAIVNPEHTRRDIVAMLKSGESKHVCFIHHVSGGLVEDVTNEIFDEAETELRSENPRHGLASIAIVDHIRDLRKHESVQ